PTAASRESPALVRSSMRGLKKRNQATADTVVTTPHTATCADNGMSDHSSVNSATRMAPRPNQSTVKLGTKISTTHSAIPSTIHCHAGNAIVCNSFSHFVIDPAMNVVGLIKNARCVLCGLCREIQIHQEDVF